MNNEKIKSLIKNILEIGNIKEKYINILIKKEHLELFITAFDLNNEFNIFYKNSGELSIRKIINYYFFTEKNVPFNDINTESIIKKILSYSIFYKIKNTNNEKILTLFGIIEYMLDKYMKVGVGYGVLYEIVTKILEIQYTKIDRKFAYDFLKKYSKGNDLFDNFDAIDAYIGQYGEESYEKYGNTESILNAILNPEYKHKKEVIEYLNYFRDTAEEDFLSTSFFEKYPDIDETFNIYLLLKIINS